jgi:predicted transcriptional regulator
MIKTRKDILEEDHNSALTQLIENEINITILEAKVSATKPGDEFNKIQEALKVRKANVDQINKVLKTIEDMMLTEKKLEEAKPCQENMN